MSSITGINPQIGHVSQPFATSHVTERSLNQQGQLARATDAKIRTSNVSEKIKKGDQLATYSQNNVDPATPRQAESLKGEMAADMTTDLENATPTKEVLDHAEDDPQEVLSQPDSLQVPHSPVAATHPSQAAVPRAPNQPVPCPQFQGISDISAFRDLIFTQDEFVDPVIFACGHTFERIQIQLWRSRSDTCPLDRGPLIGHPEIPNRALLDAQRETRRVLDHNLKAANDQNAALNAQIVALNTQTAALNQKMNGLETLVPDTLRTLTRAEQHARESRRVAIENERIVTNATEMGLWDRTKTYFCPSQMPKILYADIRDPVDINHFHQENRGLQRDIRETQSKLNQALQKEKKNDPLGNK